MILAEHPTVQRFRETNRPGTTEPPRPLDAAWLRPLCLDCGADDAAWSRSPARRWTTSGPTSSMLSHPPKNWIVADIVRIADGVRAEHWDVIQDEVTQEQSKSGLPMLGTRFPEEQS